MMREINKVIQPYINIVAPPIENEVDPPGLSLDQLVDHRQKLRDIKYTETMDKKHYGDEESLDSHLTKIQQINDIEFSKTNATSFQKYVRTYLSELEYNPSSAQMAVIAAATQMNWKRLLLVVPAGKGKSRIVAGIAVLLAKPMKKSEGAKIVIGFSSKILLKTDEQLYTNLSIVLKINFKLCVGMSEIIKHTQPVDTLIMDEADYLLFDDLCTTDDDLPKCKKLIGLTATSFQTAGAIEFEWLQKNNIRQILSTFALPNANEKIEYSDLSCLFNESGALLIYCTP